MVYLCPSFARQAIVHNLAEFGARARAAPLWLCLCLQVKPSGFIYVGGPGLWVSEVNGNLGNGARLPPLGGSSGRTVFEDKNIGWVSMSYKSASF